MSSSGLRKLLSAPLPSRLSGSMRRIALVNACRAINDGRIPALSNTRRRSFSTKFYSPDDEPNRDKKTALVLGSSGSLGRVIAQALSKQYDMNVIGADVVAPKGLRKAADASGGAPTNDQLAKHGVNGGFVQVTGDAGLGHMTTSLLEGLSGILKSNGDDTKLDVIVCAAGGFQMDPKMPYPTHTHDEVCDIAHNYSESIEQMLQVNLHPPLAANFAAHQHMNADGLFVIIGATAALNATPGMMGYGISKLAAHHVVYTVGETTLKSNVTKAKRKAMQPVRKHAPYLDTLSVVGVLPTTIDTPANRKSMPDGNFDTWVQPDDIAKEIGNWTKTPSLRPHSGALVKVVRDKTGAAFRLVR